MSKECQCRTCQAAMRRDLAEAAIVELRKFLEEISPEGRVAYFEKVQEGYCKHCGIDDPRCQCTNDE